MGGGPQQHILALGYATWEPGQLDEEIQMNTWLPIKAHQSLVFDNNPSYKWTQALCTLGHNAFLMCEEIGHA